MTEHQQKMERYKRYLPQCASGELSLRKCARKLDITVQAVCKLKKRYLEEGDAVFTHKNKGRVSPHKTSSDYEDMLIKIYYENNWNGCPYSTFWRALKNFHNIQIPYSTLVAIMHRHKIKSYRDYKTKEKPKHESRMERPRAGELLQLDASKHDWFMNGTYTNLHGAIDDATHIVTGLYFCDNECRLGYNEVLRQTFLHYGKPEAVYIDRHSSFVTTPHGKLLTLEEKLQKEKSSDTHFNNLMRDLGIEVILALSAQGKGRIERLWQTLQGILPFYFRHLGINNNQDANKFLMTWLPKFNAEFSRPPRNQISRYRDFYKKNQIDYLLSIKETRKTDEYGMFLFHDHYFELVCNQKACRKFTLCLSEQFGIKAYMNGLFYDVILVDNEVTNVVAGKMPQVEQDLIARYLLNDLHNDSIAAI